jgi:hypothetical protein
VDHPADVVVHGEIGVDGGLARGGGVDVEAVEGRVRGHGEVRGALAAIRADDETGDRAARVAVL